MSLALEYFDAAGTATADGVFIPIANLPGLDAVELAAAEPIETKESKVLLALLNQIYDTISPTAFSALGLTMSKSTPTGGGAADLVNLSFGSTWQKLVNLDTDTVSAIPVPTAGANVGLGDFGVADIFAGAAKVDAAEAVAGAGVVINTSGLTPYSSLSHADLTVAAGEDNRGWFMALVDHMATDTNVRSAAIATGITAATRGNVGAQVIPADFTAATDPTTGISSTDLPKLGLITRTLSWTIQVALNQATQLFEVNAVTL